VKLKTDYCQWNGVEHARGRLFCLILFNRLQRKAMAFLKREKDQRERRNKCLDMKERKQEELRNRRNSSTV